MPQNTPCTSELATMNRLQTTDARTPDHHINPLLLHRWSPRAMSGEVVKKDTLNRLFEAARWAPSSYNEQPWRFLYATRESPSWKTFLGLLVEANQAWAHTAGALVVVLSKKTFARNGSDNRVHVFDAGAAWQNIALQGADMGLVVHGMGGFDVERARKELGVPDDFSVIAMIAVGRPGPLENVPENMRGGETPSGRNKVAEFAFEGAFPKR